MQNSAATGSRFEVRRRLGSGGFGEVFEAWDYEHDATIALKTLHQQNPTNIRRFKHEFRSLAGLSHPNLVQLFELVGDDDRWSFTMELVRGNDFLSAVRIPDDDSSAKVVDLTRRAMGDEPTAPGLSVGVPPYDDERLRASLRQLARGLRALHAAGKLHRDIKPHNVLVTDNGRVVILDFGMVKELAEPHAGPGEGAFVGTPHYMAPEQAVEGDVEVGEAADWYSVGVMLYQVLCGDFPVKGRSAVQILLRKQVAEAPGADEFPDGTPDDLRRVCQLLLAREPAERPGADDILRLLGDRGPTEKARVVRRDADGEGPFVGRDEELGELRAAIGRTQRLSRVNAVDVTGASGIGKTELVRRFLTEIRGRPDVWVLRGRCYENESVPYKALDGVVDDLVDRLSEMEPSELDHVLHGELAALARVFGVFANLPAVRDVATANPSALDSPEVRQSAFETLRDVFARVCDFVTPVVVIDDVHWGDLDSADALAELFREPAPAMMIVTTFRTEEASDSPFLTRYEEVLASRANVQHVRLALRELSDEDASTLARELVGEDDGNVDRIVAEAKGSPYFIDELARFRARPGSGARTLDDAIEARLGQLDEPMRRFLEVVALAGRPLDVRLVREVSGVKIDLPHAMARLRNERLVRVRPGVGREAVETYHDRIRETVRDGLPSERRRRSHLRIAHVLEREGSDAPEVLAMHFREGGDSGRAATYLGAASEVAMEALAFDRAAAACRDALELGDWENDARRELLERLGVAQSHMGRGNEAAEAFIRAAVLAEETAGLELRRRAAAQLLRAGQIERGLELLYEVLEELGVRPPRSDFNLNFSLGWLAFRNWLRGFRYDVRDEPLPERDAIRLDTCSSAAGLLGTIDVKRGAYFQMLSLRESLRLGDAGRLAEALALSSVHLAGRSSTRSKADALLSEATKLAKASDDVFAAESFVDFTRGMGSYMAADMQQARRWFADVGERLETRRSEFVWELALLRLYELYPLFYLGGIAEIAQRIPRMLEETRRRDDLLGWTAVGMLSHFWHLAEDRPELAEQNIRAAKEAWSSSAYHVQHYFELQARVRIALYRREPQQGLDAIQAGWKGAKKGLMLHYDLTRLVAFDLRARTLLAIADRVPERRGEALRRARRDIAELRKLPVDMAQALATLLQAQYAHLTGNSGGRDELLARAEAQFSALGAETFVNSVRMRLGDALGPRRGGELRDRALQWASRQGVGNPARFFSIFAPVRVIEDTE